MHNKTMNAYILFQLLEELAHTGPTDENTGLSPEEELLLYCYRKLDKRDRRDILCFLSEKISH